MPGQPHGGEPRRAGYLNHRRAVVRPPHPAKLTRPVAHTVRLTAAAESRATS